MLKLTNSAATASTNNLVQPAGNPACKQQLKIKKTGKGESLTARFVSTSDAQLSAIGRRLLDLLHT